VLHDYQLASGQSINLSKTNVLFSKGAKDDKRAQITHTQDIREVSSHDKYLGLLTFNGRPRKKPFLFIVDRIKKRLTSWMDRMMSWAGREVPIKVFKLPSEICHTIQTTTTHQIQKERKSTG